MRRSYWSGAESSPRRKHAHESSDEAEATTGGHHVGGAPARPPAMVRPPSPPPAVAGAGRRDAGPVPRLAVGDHAAADDCESRRALFRKIRRALAKRLGARRRFAG